MLHGLILLLILGWFGYLRDASATTIYVNASVTRTGTGTVSSPCKSLRCGLFAASNGDTILIAPGIYTGSSNNNLCNLTKTCPRTFTLQGNGPSDSVIFRSSPNTNLRAITLVNRTLVKMRNLTFEGFVLNEAVAVSRSILLTGIPNGGGAVSSLESNLDLENIRFVQNAAAVGGALRLAEHSNATIKYCTFSENRASVFGGGVFLAESSITVLNSLFLANLANGSADLESDGSGGALYGIGLTGNYFRMSSSQFLNNTAGENGGAVYVQSLSPDKSTFHGEDLVFLDNAVVGHGNCFSLSTCDSSGGALYVDVASVEINRCNFTRNSANTAAPNSFALGGALFVTTKVISPDLGVSVSNSHFQDNFAGNFGGAIYSLNQLLQLGHSTLVKNVVGVASNLFGDSANAGGAVWYSSQIHNSTIQNCEFTKNAVRSGWGGALFLTNALPHIKVESSTFSENKVTSSYTFSAQGGAIMVSLGSKVMLNEVNFLNNTAVPRFSATPFTLSGFGGAIYLTSSEIAMELCNFVFNGALTGQFDDGSAGGALLLENGNQAVIRQSNFVTNYAQGYFGYSTYASSGSGGAIMMKFTSAEIITSRFVGNWVSVGGTRDSIGGAIAIFFDYSGGSSSPVRILNTSFSDNTAFSQLCRSASSSTGQGGAIAVMGASQKGVYISFSNFSRNAAVSSRTSLSPSLGGALVVSLVSNVSTTMCSFKNNLALFGLGNDIASFAGEEAEMELQNQLYMIRTQFTSLIADQATQFEKYIKNISHSLCYYSEVAEQFVHFDRRLETNDGAEEIDGPPSWYGFHRLSDEKRLLQVEKELDVLETVRDGNIEGAAGPDTKEAALKAKYRLELEQELSALRSKLPKENPASSRQLRSRNRIYFTNTYLESPSVVITSGSAYFDRPSFNGDYHIFAGNFVYLRELYATSSASSSQFAGKTPFQVFEDATVTPTKLRIDGEESPRALMLTIFKAELTLSRRDNHTMLMKSLRMWNGTVYLANNVTVEGNSSIIDSAIVGIENFNGTFTERPTVNFVGDLHTGIGILATGDTVTDIENSRPGMFNFGDDKIDALKTFLTGMPLLVVSACNIKITSYCAITGPLVNSKSYGVENTVRLQNGARIIVDVGALLEINAGTAFIANSSDAVVLVNDGTILLNPLDVRIGSSITKGKGDDRVPSVRSSVYSGLRVFGRLVQSAIGSIVLTVANDLTSIPILDFATNRSLGGTIVVHFYSQTQLHLPTYGGLFTSNWTIAVFESMSAPDDTIPARILTTPGIGVSVVFTKEKTGNVTAAVFVENVACSYVINYTTTPTDGPLTNNEMCSACTQNTSCKFCQTSEAFGCVEHGYCAGTTWPTCCGEKSCGADGDCDESTYKCEYSCPTIFEPEEGCKTLNTTGVAMVLVVSFAALFAAVAVFYYRCYREQKSEILEELRSNLLAPAALNKGMGKKSAVPIEFIEDLQQSLILKDVFVNYDELKIEERVGEGSFGVVFKASFRGAQVAVKQMRSPLFAELTQNDIEEFRKEAYMMSRLRHPNIVLVMGISLVDVEPAAKKLPMDDDEDASNSIPAAPSSTPLSFGRKKVEAKTTNKTVCIITEYLDQGSLADILYGPTRLPPEVFTYELVLACALQAARGMLYLHSHQPPICHRDLKSSNLVVDDHWVVKVTDFGMSRIVPEKVQEFELGIGPTAEAERESEKMKQSMDESLSMSFRDTRATETGSGQYPVDLMAARYSTYHPEMTSNLGTTAWCAPELLTSSNKTRYSVKVDVYSFGMVMWELWEKKRPYDDLTSRFDIMDAIRSGKRPPISENCPAAYRSIMQRCWQAEPTRRPTFKYIERYLKDELARVKRQKTVGRLSESVDRAASTITNFIGDLQGNRPSHVSRASQDTLHSNSASSPQEIPPPSLVAQAPENRAPLVAFERSFSYLTAKSPDAASTFEANHMQNSPALDSWLNEAPGRMTPVTERSSHSSQARPSNQWRDSYVLRFSGWQASKPDAGLPPSLHAGGSAVKSTQPSQPVKKSWAIGSIPPRHSEASNLTANLEEQRRQSINDRSSVRGSEVSVASSRFTESETVGRNNSHLIDEGGVFALDSVDGPTSNPLLREQPATAASPLRASSLAAAASAFVAGAIESAWSSSKTNRSSGGSSTGGSPRYVTAIPVANSGSGSGSLTALPTHVESNIQNVGGNGEAEDDDKSVGTK